MVRLADIDAHEQPPEELRANWKAFSRTDHSHMRCHPRIDELMLSTEESEFEVSGKMPRAQVEAAFSRLGDAYVQHAQADVPILHHPLLPGLLIIPSLVPPAVQEALLDRMVHRDLSNPKHLTNLHPHYHIPYPDGSSASASPYEDSRSLFALSPDSSVQFTPKDPLAHKPLSIRQVMQRRLHWVTLGGQYDWTKRLYPGEAPPQFPEDISQFLETLFPATLPQAAIVNFYSPGDTMMMHRDVSEDANKGLISLSFGCDGIFMIAPSGAAGLEPAHAQAGKSYLLLRLQSGDAIYMTGESRYAWHGVPKVLQDSCPAHLQDWPARDGKFEDWRGWMNNKRINLNVRQMSE